MTFVGAETTLMEKFLMLEGDRSRIETEVVKMLFTPGPLPSGYEALSKRLEPRGELRLIAADGEPKGGRESPRR